MDTNSSIDADLDSGRALILCCDGTGNIWGNGHDTNVVKLARLIESNERQLLYYDPGVGTTDNFPPIGLWNKSKAYVNRIVGLALASGIYEDIGKGYEFLIDNYRRNDRIYLFGFSRGAFTARSIAGMVNLFGIIRAGGKPMIPTLVRTYFFPAQQKKGRSDKTRGDIGTDIRQHFCDDHGRNAWVFFTGVWDTVATVGGIRGLHITSDKGLKQKRFTHVRHAVALHEYRNKYEPRLYQANPGDFPDDTRSFKQLWFSGCHSDVGGSYQESELSDITLRWMIDEVTQIQPALRMKDSTAIQGNYRGLAHDEPFNMPFWALTGLQRRLEPPVADKHSTALQREQSHEGKLRSVWQPLLTRTWFWLSLAAVCLVQALGGYRILVKSGIEPSLPAVAATWHHQAWPTGYCDAHSSCTSVPGITGTCWDFFLIPTYAFLFTLLLVHAHRRMNVGAEWRLPPALDRIAAQWPLVILIVADLGENIGMLQWLNSSRTASSLWSYIVPVFSTVKFAALACIGVYLLLALVRPSPKKVPTPRSSSNGIAGRESV